MIDIEEEYRKQLSEELRDEIDRAIVMDFLIASGWTEVIVEYKSWQPGFAQAADILQWLEDNCQLFNVRHLGVRFVFKHKADATAFALRWA